MTKALILANFEKGKYDIVEREIQCCWGVGIHVTRDCFDQSNFYISRINIIEWNNIHSLHACEGNMEMYSP